MENRDDIIESLIAKIAVKQEEIEKASKPVLKTNCVFPYETGTTKNIRTLSITDIIDLTSYLLQYEENYSKACKRLEITDYIKETKRFGLYTISEWIDDLKTILNQKILKEKLDILLHDKKLLESKISQDRKDQKEIDSLMSKYSI